MSFAGNRWPYFLATILLIMSLGIAASKAKDIPPLGSKEKIRMAFQQWQHFDQAGITREELYRSLASVGTNVFCEFNGGRGQAEHARQFGIRYYTVKATAVLRGPTKSQGARLAVDNYGMTCPQQFEKFKAEGGDIHAGWNRYGEHAPAYVPCPLEPGPWDEAVFKSARHGASEGWLDGLMLDAEPYGAYWFDKFGEIQCYCDHCFAIYKRHKGLDAQVERKDRHNWLVQNKHIEPYLTYLRDQSAAMLNKLAQSVWDIKPDFGFAMYPTFYASDVRSSWRAQAIAIGLNAPPKAPFVVVNQMPYWEDFTRPWWETPHRPFQKLGMKHVLGSWMASMGSYPHYAVGNIQSNYEFAMASDGFWRWGEKVFTPDDWRKFATVNQKLRQVETRLGDYILHGEQLDHFVTAIEQSGSQLHERTLIVRSYKSKGRYMVMVNNANAYHPLSAVLRFPKLPGKGRWRVSDPMFDTVYHQGDGSAVWSSDDLHKGITVTVETRGERFLQLERSGWSRKDKPHQVVRDFDVHAHREGPVITGGPPKLESPLSDQQFVYTSGNGNSLTMADFGAIAPAEEGKPPKGVSRGIFSAEGYCREPVISPDRRHVATTVWANGVSQLHLINVVEGTYANISDNAYRDRSASFSPDGTRLAFSSDRDGDWEIYTMNLDGSDQVRLTHSPGVDGWPAYSPDGKTIAFSSDRDGDLDVFTMDSGGNHQRVVQHHDGNEYDTVWSPDGSKIAFSVQRGYTRSVQISSPDGDDLLFLILGPVYNLWDIAFSPDGSEIAAAFSGHGKSGVITTRSDAGIARDQEHTDKDKGDNVNKIVEVPALVTRSGHWFSSGTATPHHLTRLFSGVGYTPDGKTIVYCSDQETNFVLYQVPAAGGESQAIPGGSVGWPTTVAW